MNMLQLSASLDHIDNQELARLTGLWRAQAFSGHAEARSIAHCFAAEQQRRSTMEFTSTSRIERMQKSSSRWKFW